MKNFFYLVVIVVLCSCEEIIEVADISNEKVVLLAPTDNAILDTAAVHFYWEPISEDSAYYQIQVATPDFEDAVQIVHDSIILQNEFSTTLDENSYEWRVRAFNSGYETNYSTNSFVIYE